MTFLDLPIVAAGYAVVLSGKLLNFAFSRWVESKKRDPMNLLVLLDAVLSQGNYLYFVSRIRSCLCSGTAVPKFFFERCEGWSSSEIYKCGDINPLLIDALLLVSRK